MSVFAGTIPPAPELPRRPRVFCASLADWLDDEVPIEWLADLLALIQATPNLDWLLLTKRPENWTKRLYGVAKLDVCDCSETVSDWAAEWVHLGRIPSNVWVGATVENQEMAEKRIPQLLQIPAKVRFLSCEPVLGQVELGLWTDYQNPIHSGRDQRVHWVICGGESGPHARPMRSNWARSLRDQCKAAGVPFFFKQWGEWSELEFEDGGKPAQIMAAFERVGRRSAGCLLDGVEHKEFPHL